MMMDFTIAKYEQLCLALLGCGYECMPVESYLRLTEARQGKLAILRHDVDRKALNALKMAQLENNHGIKSTYYFRYPYTFEPKLIKQIHDLGHEVGYHYEVLSKTKGDYDKAIKMFECELSEFRRIYPVKTICMHGSPLSKYDNRDLWKRYSFEHLFIVGEAYLSVKNAAYLSDTGRTWSQNRKLRDFMPTNENHTLPLVDTTETLIRLIRSVEEPRLYILTHPERWSSSKWEWILGVTVDSAFSVGKRILRSLGRS